MIWLFLACAPASPPNPYRIEATQKGPIQTDGFVFWGWSADERYYAYETTYAGPGATRCEGSADLIVVDADKDVYASTFQPRYPEPEATTCPRPSPIEQVKLQRQRALERFGIRPGSALVEVDSTGLTRPDGTQIPFTLDTSGTEWEAGYRLVLQGTPPLVVEDGKRKRNGIQSYTLQGAFWSPSGRKAALLIRRFGMEFEGRRISWMTNAVVLR